MNGFVFIPSTQNNSVLSIFNRQGGSNVPSLANGDTISATLTAREDGRATLRTPDDFTFTVPGDSVQGNVGDLLHFKVVNQDKSGLALKQILPQAFKEIMERGNAGIEDVQHVTTSLEQMNTEADYRAEAKKEEQAKAAQAVARVRRGQRMISDNSTQSAIAAIAASGLDLNKVGFFAMNNIIQEIEAMPDISAPVDSTKVSEAEVQRVMSLIAGGISDGAIVQMLRMGKDITPENIYASRYSGGQAAKANFDGWESLDKQIARRFTREGIENTPANLEVARFLVANDLAITKHNVEATLLMRNIKSIPEEVIQKQVEASLAKGADPAQIKLSAIFAEVDFEAILETVKNLPEIKPQDVKTAMESGKALTLQNLVEVAQTPASYIEEAPIYVPTEKNLITAQRQLVEIQWKMTVQAAIRLAHKGIEVNTTHIQELVQHLRNLESETNVKMLKVAGAVPSAHNMAHMEDIFRAVQDIRPVFSHIDANIQAKLLSKQVDFTLTGVQKNAIANEAHIAYEAAAGTPNARYGDSFDKIADQFDGFLKRLGIVPTAENIRAAAILSRNEMDVTQASIDSIKLIDAKMAAVLEKLHPMVAAQMLKDGLQPLNMQMDDMLAYIKNFEDMQGYNMEDKVAQHILEMDRVEALNMQERTGMIAVYRMLNLIQKNGAAALGLALKQDIPLTLGSLMEAAKYYDGKGHIKGIIDSTVDRALARYKILPPGSIRAALTQAVTYTDLLADALADKGAPAYLQKWMSEHGGLNKAVEDMLHENPLPPPFEPNLEQAAQAMRQFTEAPPALIAMLQNSGVMPTPTAIKAARSIRENSLVESVQEAIDEVKATDAGLGELIEEDFNFEDLMGNMSQGGAQASEETIRKLLNALSNATPTQAVREAQGLLSAQYAMEGEENKSLPILLNERFASLKLYTINEEAIAAGNAKSFLSLTTAGLGNVQSFFAMDGNQISFEFTVDGTAVQTRLEAKLGVLTGILNELGYEISNISFNHRVSTETLPQGKEVAVDPEEEIYAPLDVSDYEYEV